MVCVMEIDKAFNQMEKAEIVSLIRAVNAVVLRGVFSYLDYKIIMLKLVEVVTDGEQRGRLMGCIKWLHDYLKLCCIVSVLDLSELIEKYCVVLSRAMWL